MSFNHVRVAVLTGGELASLKAKMAHGVMRYRDDIAVVIDEKYAGQRLGSLLPYVGRDIPIVSSLQEAATYGANELLIGVSPPGGRFPPEWEHVIEEALQRGMRVVNGLHIRLRETERFKMYAGRDQIVDLRYSYTPKDVASGKAAKIKKNVILTVGSDCASGKMTTALELHRECLARGLRADFIPTGQTGMYIAGKGFAIDAVISDFMAGAVEEFVCESAGGNDFIFVEGQGSLTHPAYSGVTLGLLHGSAPNLVVFTHDVSRNRLAYYDRDIPPLDEQMEMVERLACYQRKCRVLGISLFAAGTERQRVCEIIEEMEKEYRIPVFAPLVTGCRKFVDILEEYR